MAPEVAYSALGRACVWRGGGGVWGLDRRAWSRVALLLPSWGGGVFGGVGFGGRGAHGSLDLVEIYEMSLWTYV